MQISIEVLPAVFLAEDTIPCILDVQIYSYLRSGRLCQWKDEHYRDIGTQTSPRGTLST